MKVYVFGFWDGFLENTNAVNFSAFKNLFEKVFQTDIEIGNTPEECDILLETIFEKNTQLYSKPWKYSFLFSGESRLNPWHKDYTCVLYGERNHDNVINMPLFIPYLVSSQLWNTCASPPVKITEPPPKDVCVIISNPDGKERNAFLEKLEQQNIRVDYAGKYKNNTTCCSHYYNTPEFSDFIRQYKFIVSMENSKGDTYITEKITHGFISNTIPIYWGSSRVTDYFQQGRFLQVQDTKNPNDVLNKMTELIQNPKKYMEMIRHPVLTEHCRNLDHIARDIRNKLFSTSLSPLQQVYAISSPVFEPQRFKRLNEMFCDELKINVDQYQFCCPTYKQTITPEQMRTYVKSELIKSERPMGMKKSEISLFLNYKAVLESIERNYLDGVFLVLESDAAMKKTLVEIQEFLQIMYSRKSQWDLIHIGTGKVTTQQNVLPYIGSQTAYRERSFVSELPQITEEDITNDKDKYRIVRKYCTRCTDSFLWNYSGVVKFLKYLNEYPVFNVPFDYYMCQFFETHHPSFKQYLTVDEFFLQRSNAGLEPSTIQSDWN